MPGRSISVEVRARVIGMLQNWTTANQAAMQAGVHRATVHRIKSKFFKQAQWKTGLNLAERGRLRRSKISSWNSLPWDSGLNRLLNLLPTFDRLQEWQSTLALYGTDINLLASSLVDLAWGTSWLPTTSGRDTLGAVIVAVGEGISGATSFGQTIRVSTLISRTGVNVYGGESMSVMFL